MELVASTGDITVQDASRAGSDSSADLDDHDQIRGYFETAKWTADGTTVLTYSSTNLVSGYIVPEDLLAPKTSPLHLTPQATIQLPEPSNVLASAPYFTLSEPYTNQVLVSARDHPIQLYYLAPNASSPTSPSHSPAASYPFAKARSETFLSATSLIWPGPGLHFIAGARNLLAKFDVSRPGASSEPVLRIKTIPSERHLSKGGGVGMRGTVSALGAQPPEACSGASLVAAGTWTRWVGLYDFAQAGACVATWSIASASDSTDSETGEAAAQRAIGGGGVTQTIWSPCGRYLLVSERRSRGVLVYDVRVAGRLLGWLESPEARGNQRVLCDVFPGQQQDGGFEVWSGTSTHGLVRVWEGVGMREGPHGPSWEWRAHDPRSTIGAACVHPSGTVVATCSGSWAFDDDYRRGDSAAASGTDGGSSSEGNDSAGNSYRMAWMRRRNMESSLKIWSLADSRQGEEVPEQLLGGELGADGL
ncbi:hypothetical protein DL769_007571 [Monosporascus sp. CRB-8-3]|nr:hypothetical protein DL769_007571 [Monosporascus sp. CRB-8-3]